MERVQVPPWKYAAIGRLHKKGQSVRQIAETVKLSASRVQTFLKKQEKKANGHAASTGERNFNGHQSNSDERVLENAISYSFGHCETWLGIYAASAGVPGPALTRGVAELLLRKARR